MVNAVVWALVTAGLTAGAADDAVRPALSRGAYDWYDAKSDEVKPVWPPREPEIPDLDVGDASLSPLALLGQWLSFLVLALCLGALVGLLAWYWRRYRPDPDELVAPGRSSRSAERVGSLPAGMEVDVSDPLAQARRLRQAGDLGGAIVHLFVHQLLTLDRLRLTKLAPGRTARQLVRAVSSDAVRAKVEPTLRLFEVVYYGHHRPDPAAFEAAWTEAEVLERWVTEGVVP